MMPFTRYAIYHLPGDADLADFGARWLGWDVIRGSVADQPDLPGLDGITATPRKYGFHATLKPPFRLAEGRSEAELKTCLAELASACPPAACDGLALAAMGRFLALVPHGDSGEIDRVAAHFVRALDGFRAPPEATELRRRRKSRLSARQESLLQAWGYPFVMEEFRFHMTLSGRLPDADLEGWRELLSARLPNLPAPFRLREVALVGERPDGMFQLIRRYPLNG
jgi:hypothetical protein